MPWPNAITLLRHVYGGDTPEDSIRVAVEQVLLQAGATGPPAPLDLTGSLCDVERIEAVAMSSAGCLVPLPQGGYVIQINEADSPGRQRFSSAHEICHTFFNRASRLQRRYDDETVGTFAGKGEEHLCDIGAAHMLLNPAWLRDLAGGREPSLSGLLQIATACGASLEATARQVATLDIWKCSFVFWELGYRKSERELLGLAPLPGFESVAPVPTKKMRAARVYPSRGVPFFPPNASVSEESSMAEALRTQGSSSAIEEFDLGSGSLVAECESRYVGYRRADGELVHRVLSLLRWVE